MIKKKIPFRLLKNSFFHLFLLCFSTSLLFFLMVYFQFYFLIWVALVPIFYLGLKENNFLRILFFASLTGFLIFLSFYWLSNYSVLFYWLMSLVVIIFAILIGLFYFLLCKFQKTYSLRFLYFPIIWFFLMIAFSFWEYGNMWMKFAYFQPMMYPLGYYLGSTFYTIFIILFNSLVAQFFYSKNKRVFYIIVVFLSLIIFSSIYSYYKIPEGKEIKVVLVQGNVDDFWEVRVGNPERFFAIYENLTLKAKEFNPDFVFWPEYSLSTDLSRNHDLAIKVGKLAREMNSYIVLGAFAFVDENKTSHYDFKYDRLYVFSPDGYIINYYDASAVQSVHGDIIPSHYSENFISTTAADFLVGVCFEEYIVTNFNDETGKFIVFLSNNQHFDNTKGIYLISQFSKLRALEQKKYVIRVSNTGITQIINPYGKVETELEPYKSSVLIRKIYI